LTHTVEDWCQMHLARHDKEWYPLLGGLYTPSEKAVSVDFSLLTSCWFTTLISFFPTSGKLSIWSTHRLGTYLTHAHTALEPVQLPSDY